MEIPPSIDELTSTVRAPAVALSGADGQIRAGGMEGLFVSDRRVLSEARIRFGGIEPDHLARLPEGVGRVRFIAVARGFGDRGADPTIRIERTREVTPEGMREEIAVSSTALVPVRAQLTLDLRGDLTPLSAARAGASDAAPVPSLRPGPVLTWGLDDLAVEVGAPGADLTMPPVQLTWPVELAPGGRECVSWQVRVMEARPLLTAPRGPVEWSRPRVRCDDARLARLVTQSLDDLESLRLTEDGETTFIGAGAPWFLTLFGRDCIWTARMLLPLGTALAESTLWTLARRQGGAVSELTGEAPGKIMHELRPDDPRASVVQGKPLPSTYYGTVDATLLWISLLADAWRWGLADAGVAALLPHLTRALGWLERYADPDGDGFLEYLDTHGHGLANQGWKDSGNAIRFHDATLGRPPIALCEVQGYAHRAALDAAELLDAFDTGLDADAWRGYAGDLAARFRDRFWVNGPLGPYPALAIDADNRPVDSLTSNIGHLLGTGLLNAEEEATVARLLAAPPLAGGYGIRTMSNLDKAFAPLSYHCGSVWPHDTAIAVLGLAGAGAHAAAGTAIAGLLAAAEAFGYRLPELYGGDARDEFVQPVPYPDACRPQAWSAAAGVAVLQAVLGLSAHVPRGEVRLAPLAGHGLGALEVRGLRIGGHAIDVTLDRDGHGRVEGLPPYLRLAEPVEQPVG